MKLKAETQRVFVVSGHQMSEDPHPDLMPIPHLLELQRRIGTIYPDINVAIRPDGDVELEFKEGFYGNVVPDVLEEKVAAFMADYGYKV